MQHIIHQLQKEKKLRLLTSIIMIVFSAFMQCYIMNVFMAPCNLISGGFTGLALLINKVCALVNINFPTQVGIIALNVPAAILCYKHISPRFTFLSCVQFFLVSFFISIFHFEPGSLTLAHSQNSQMSFMYGFFFVKFLFFTVVCVVIVI